MFALPLSMLLGMSLLTRNNFSQVKNPFEQNEIVGITNYIDFGFELQTRYSFSVSCVQYNMKNPVRSLFVVHVILKQVSKWSSSKTFY